MKTPRHTNVFNIVCSSVHLKFWIFWIVTVLGVSVTTCFASEYDELIRQDKDISAANASLNRTYQKILTVLNGRVTTGDLSADKFRQAFVDAEKAWIKWRDSEALMRAYATGSVGGSALLEDLHSALMTLIKERQEYLGSLQIN
jgi:uncharacterized protein YecT (DUF1311 family)